MKKAAAGAGTLPAAGEHIQLSSHEIPFRLEREVRAALNEAWLVVDKKALGALTKSQAATVVQMALERMDLYHLWKKDEWEGAFTKADADKDGAIDREEAKALLVDLLEQKLAAVDKK